MKTVALILALALLSPAFAQDESPEDQIEFMRNFFCVMATQRYLMQKSSELPPLADPRQMPESWKKLLAIAYSNCIDDVLDQQLMAQLASARTQEDINQIDFPFYHKINIKEYLAKGDFTLTRHDEVTLETSQKTAEKIMKLQEEQRRNNPEAAAMQDHQDQAYDFQEPQGGPASTDLVSWVMESRFRNIILLSGLTLVLFVITSLSNLLFGAKNAKTEVQGKSKKHDKPPAAEQKKEKKVEEERKDGNEENEQSAPATQEKKIKKRG